MLSARMFQDACVCVFLEGTVACSFTQPCNGCGADFQDVPRAPGLSRGHFPCWYLGLLLQLSISGNDIEAGVGGDCPVIKCVCREI